jgi:chromosome partitioning protein
MRIAVANQKGGTGKTRTSVGVAAALGDRGRRVLVVDSDVNQGAGRAVTWHRRLLAHAGGGSDPLSIYRGDLSVNPAAVQAVATVGFECVDMAELAELRLGLDGYDDVIFDCPPGHPERIVAAINLADLVVVPVEPNMDQVEGVVHVQRLMDTDCKATKPVVVVLARVNRSRLAAGRMRRQLGGRGFDVARTGVPDRSEIGELYPEKHPKTSRAGWAAWQSLADELCAHRTKEELTYG